MATDYGSVDTKCPFYITEDAAKIKCEGVEKGSSTVLEFRGKKFKNDVKQRYCEGDYEKCKLYQMLDQKYK